MPRKKLLVLVTILIIFLPINFGLGFLIGYKITSNKAEVAVSYDQLQNIGPYFLPHEGIVTKVLDGDTIEISPPNQMSQIGQISQISPSPNRLPTRSVRYLGIDAPNLGEPKYEEAKTTNERLVLGKTVTLEYDVPQNDKYGRILAWVWCDGKLINREMLKLGLAKPLTMEDQHLKYDLNYP
jgi:endonuclease YncB( thermonuclease family)